MKRAAIAFASIAALMISSSAFAASVTGAIKSVDAKKYEVVLDNGKSYVFSKTTDLSKFKAGDKVMVTFEAKSGKNEASAIASAK